MRLTAIKTLERSIGGPRWQLTIKQDNLTSFECTATQLYTFQNGWTLFLLENFFIDSGSMILANRDGEVSLAPPIKPPFTLTPRAAAQTGTDTFGVPHSVLDGPCPLNPEKKFRECWFCWNELEHVAPGTLPEPR